MAAGSPAPPKKPTRLHLAAELGSRCRWRHLATKVALFWSQTTPSATYSSVSSQQQSTFLLPFLLCCSNTAPSCSEHTFTTLKWHLCKRIYLFLWQSSFCLVSPGRAFLYINRQVLHQLKPTGLAKRKCQPIHNCFPVKWPLSFIANLVWFVQILQTAVNVQRAVSAERAHLRSQGATASWFAEHF